MMLVNFSEERVSSEKYILQEKIVNEVRRL